MRHFECSSLAYILQTEPERSFAHTVFDDSYQSTTVTAKTLIEDKLVKGNYGHERF